MGLYMVLLVEVIKVWGDPVDVQGIELGRGWKNLQTE